MIGPLVALAILGGASAIHPLHTALVELSYQQESGSVAIQLRVFSDDLAAALGSNADLLPADSLLSRYARGTLALADPAGRPVVLHWESAERSGDTVLLRLRASLPGGMQRARILAALLWERFPDQVNIVRATYGGRTVTLLFTRGDHSKTFP